ncbi:hypothetical protein SBA4_3680010 [Candidatus Sulfopaludibacter sp. SbA4]|nr:hypothetical protein SBA4_3680010 [Candidatus Sulfopaludibacter sp. SbA4]
MTDRMRVGADHPIGARRVAALRARPVPARPTFQPSLPISLLVLLLNGKVELQMK